MKDERGFYYNPDPANRAVRAYVRKGADGEIEFRLWEKEHPEVWEQHGWLPFSVIEQANELYRKERNPDANPLQLYDLNVAQALLRQTREDF